MIKSILKVALGAAALAAVTTSSFAQWGLFNDDRSYIGLNAGGTTNFFSVWSNGTTSGFLTPIQGANLGTFTIGSGTLNIVQYDVKTFKNGSGDVTGGTFFYRVWSGTPSGSFISQSLSFIEDLPAPGDQKWGFSGASLNLLAGIVTPGTYTLEFYGEMGGTSPTTFVPDNNGGANYTATFTAVPEPSTVAMLALGGIALAGYAIRRRRA